MAFEAAHLTRRGIAARACDFPSSCVYVIPTIQVLQRQGLCHVLGEMVVKDRSLLGIAGTAISYKLRSTTLGRASLDQELIRSGPEKDKGYWESEARFERLGKGVTQQLQCSIVCVFDVSFTTLLTGELVS